MIKSRQHLRAFNDEEEAAIFDRYSDGVTIRRIAKDTNSCYVTIRKVITRVAARRGIKLEKYQQAEGGK